MSENGIEDYISGVLVGDAKANAMEFIQYLRKHKLVFERFRKGYWENKLYWLVKSEEECVCFILINGYEDYDIPWIIWSDDSVYNYFEDYPLDEQVKEIAWKYIDFCEKCDSCNGGTCKKIFGKEFANVCRTTFRFFDPDREALTFVKKMVEIRINEIDKKYQQHNTVNMNNIK